MMLVVFFYEKSDESSVIELLDGFCKERKKERIKKGRMNERMCVKFVLLTVVCMHEGLTYGWIFNATNVMLLMLMFSGIYSKRYSRRRCSRRYNSQHANPAGGCSGNGLSSWSHICPRV